MYEMDIDAVRRLLPHRYPFLLVDRVLELEPNQRVVAIKNVTMNEPFFNGHFPISPVMPGVLMIEAMAQASGILSLRSLGIEEQPADVSELFYFAGIDEARFKRKVIPGDVLTLEIGSAQATSEIVEI